MAQQLHMALVVGIDNLRIQKNAVGNDGGYQITDDRARDAWDAAGRSPWWQHMAGTTIPFVDMENLDLENDEGADAAKLAMAHFWLKGRSAVRNAGKPLLMSQVLHFRPDSVNERAVLGVVGDHIAGRLVFTALKRVVYPALTGASGVYPLDKPESMADELYDSTQIALPAVAQYCFGLLQIKVSHSDIKPMFVWYTQKL